MLKSEFKDFNKHYPKVKLIFGDGKNLDFPDNYFDIVFCNAVVEHVGEYQEQKKFIHEICRVGKKIFVATPNYWFPLDAHTLIPFAHWLPQKIKGKIYKMFGREYWADINHLNLLTAKDFISLFLENFKVKLYKQKILGFTSNLIAIVEKS
jgi:ubiquinone/menaquinone biosynthesis C-methylase UbiE